ncbi:putative TATA box-binding protein-associated factor RNA polymerase I subunit C [Helianthus anomalus]
MMDHSDEWKSLWPISSVHSPPLLLPQTTITTTIGPLFFTPQTHHHIFTLPSTPTQIPPYPSLTPSRFLHKSSSSILPSTATSVSPQLLSSVSSNPEQLLAHNCLQLLRCPGTDSTLAFFPTGPNSDRVGFVVLSVEDSRLTVVGDYGETEVCSFKDGFVHRIVEISVSPLADYGYGSGENFDSIIIGYLLVSTTNSVHYYNIRIRMEHSGNITPRLELVDHKSFKSSVLVLACWSPHIPEESLVLLDNGDLYLFDLDSFSGPTMPSQRLTGKKVKVLWEEYVGVEKGRWLSCDFSWHPRIFVVVRSSGVFLVDARSETYSIIPLLKHSTEEPTNDGFLVFSVVGPDRFYFTLASNHMLFLCDIRKPMMPVLRWAHNVANPSYIFVSSLSELRSLCEDDTYNWASEAGYGILLGSFWNCEYSLFCYGPPGPDSSTFYAWGLPSDLSLGTHECRCGSCLVKEDFSKDQLPVWINWQQKKDFVLGFGILDEEISSQLFEPDNFGGFAVITLTASGNLELQRYHASWDYSQTSEKCHVDQSFDLEDYVLFETGEEGYKFRKVFQYLKLDWLDGYLNSDLNRILSINLYKNSDNDVPRNASFSQEFHECICRSLKEYSSGGAHVSINIIDLFKDVYLPTSIHEIALRSVWANLPKKVLRLAFSTYSDLPNVPAKLKNIPFEFLEVPCEQPSLPPFFFRVPSSRSGKWSEKHKPSDHLVGPITPIPFLMAYHKTLMLKADNRPADSEINLECDKVTRVANEVIGSESQSFNDHTVSLADDNEDALHSCNNLQHFSSYKTRATMDGSDFEDEKHRNILFRVGQKDEKEIFDSGCLLQFKFKEQNTSFGEKEKKFYKIYKRQFSDFKQKFDRYQAYLTESNIASHE